MTMPKKCKECCHHKILTHSILPYNFCTKLNISFNGSEADEFLNCEKRSVKTNERNIIQG